MTQYGQKREPTQGQREAASPNRELLQSPDFRTIFCCDFPEFLWGDEQNSAISSLQNLMANALCFLESLLGDESYLRALTGMTVEDARGSTRSTVAHPLQSAPCMCVLAVETDF